MTPQPVREDFSGKKPESNGETLVKIQLEKLFNIRFLFMLKLYFWFTPIKDKKLKMCAEKKFKFTFFYIFVY